MSLYDSLKRPVLLGLIGIPLLQACTPMQIRNTQTGTWVPIQAGTLEVRRDITIPAGRTRAFFQGGMQVSGINEFKPFCQLEVSTLLDKPQTVHPDSFTITRVGGKAEQVVEAAPVMLAALDGFFVQMGNDNGGGPSRITQMLNFRLHSDHQPDVRRLSCGGAFDDPWDADAPTVQDIATALGDYATLMVR